MASTVMGLFEQRSNADAALSELVNNGFSRSDIDLKTPNSDAGAGFDSLIRELQGEGVPADDARLYAEGVRAGDVLEIAHTSDERATLAQDIMNRHGALNIHDASIQRGGVLPAAGIGAAGAAATALETTADRTNVTADRTNQDKAVIPIVEEQLEVGKRQVQRGARIHTTVTERPVEEQVTLREERVSVERRTADRPVTDADRAFQEQTVDVTETAEVPTVAKTAHVVGEVVIGKEAAEHTETVRDTVRRTDVEVEEAPGKTTPDRL